MTFSNRFLIGYAIAIKHKNNSSNVLSFCHFFIFVEFCEIVDFGFIVRGSLMLYGLRVGCFIF